MKDAMEDMVMIESLVDCLHSTESLKQLIVENPDLPIVVLAGEDANTGDYSYLVCTSVRYEVGEVLDAVPPYRKEYIETDREWFEEHLEEWIWDEMCYEGRSGDGVEPSEEEFQKRLTEAKEKFAPYWKRCIILYVDN